MVATLRTAISHHSRKRPFTRTDLGTGGAACRTVPAVHQARQAFLLPIGQQVCTVRGTMVARTLAVRTRFGTLLQHRIDLRFLRLGLMRDCTQADNGEGERQRHRTDSTEHALLHGKLPFLRDCQPASDRNCRSTQMTETKLPAPPIKARGCVHLFRKVKRDDVLEFSFPINNHSFKKALP